MKSSTKNDKKPQPSRQKPQPSRHSQTRAEAAPIVDPRPAVARTIFGQADEVHRPRLVLFVGASTSSLAPVAALWSGALAAEGRATIVLASADGAPATLSPEMVVALSEDGLDPRRLIARTLTPELLAAADLVVTLSEGRRTRLKLPPTTRRREHWTLPDPGKKARAKTTTARAAGSGTSARRRGGATPSALDDARALRDAMRARVAMLVFSEGWGRPEISREDARVTRDRSDEAHDAFGPAERSTLRSPGLAPGMVPEVTPAWFPQPSLSPPSLR